MSRLIGSLQDLQLSVTPLDINMQLLGGSEEQSEGSTPFSTLQDKEQ